MHGATSRSSDGRQNQPLTCGDGAVSYDRDWTYEIATVLVMLWFILSTAAGWFGRY